MTQQSKSSRCTCCNKKTGIDYYTCKCNSEAKFCAEHKFPFAHHCTIDQAKQQRDKLTQLNTKLVPQKFTTMDA